ncbi:MAG: ROK family transcriptional regulator [Chloroflexi bacterium]|jgi:glucokinase-like ROK family protein|nr:ROK family transcriptional regulator [Chloroflexota bacterium]
MSYPLTVTASAMRAINRSAILETIRRDGPISQSVIAERLDISLPTVMRIVGGLKDEDLVRALIDKEWSGGRRRSLLEFNAESYLVLGIDLGGTKMYGALSDLGGTVLDEVIIGPHGTSGEESYDRLVNLIDRLLASPKAQGRRVRGIGVGVPGITLHQEGIVRWAYTLEWKDFPLKARLSDRYKLPITVDNDVNLAALGELWFGAGQNTQNMILIAIGTGIGAGIIIDGALYRGSTEASGEIGSMVPGREFLGKDFRDFGALESVASGTGIAARAREVLKTQAKQINPDDVTAEDVFDAARQGQAWAWGVIEETVDLLAMAIANLTVMFDPEMIILGGGVSRSADMLIEPISRRINGAVPALPRLVTSRLGLRAAAMGAITNVLHNTSDYYIVRKLS